MPIWWQQCLAKGTGVSKCSLTELHKLLFFLSVPNNLLIVMLAVEQLHHPTLHLYHPMVTVSEISLLSMRFQKWELCCVQSNKSGYASPQSSVLQAEFWHESHIWSHSCVGRPQVRDGWTEVKRKGMKKKDRCEPRRREKRLEKGRRTKARQ